jgi:spermidine synthase
LPKGRKPKGKSSSVEARENGRAPLGGRSALFAVLLALSGAAALIYQVLWVRELTLVVGVEVYSISIAVSAFFAGLALGGALLGPVADRSRRPLNLYAQVEIGVAIVGVATTLLLAHAGEAFVALQAHAGMVAWLLPFVIVGTPAFLMGGTLPIAIRSLAKGGNPIARAGGWVYAVNTGGAIAGALLSSFVMIGRLGVHGTAIIAALMNLMAAGAAMAIERGTPLAAEPAQAAVEGNRPGVAKARLALTLYAVAGAIALGYEVVWSQAMAQFLSTRVYAFSVVLATYLLGLVIGSAIYARFANRVRDAWGVFAALISLGGLVALLEIALLGLWQLNVQYKVAGLVFAATGSTFARMCASFGVASAGVVLLPTILLGAAFPAVLHLTASEDRPGRGVGTVLALNTAGGIAGTLLTGFVLIPVFGIVRSLAMLAVAAAVVGMLAVWFGAGVMTRMKWGVYVVAAVALAAGLLTPKDRLAKLLLTTRGGGELVFYEEGRGATVAVSQVQSKDHVFRRLYIQGVSNSGDAMPSMRYMRLQAMLPLMIHRGEPKSVMVIGFGTGITAGETLRYPGLEKRVCAELLPAVVRSGTMFPENYKAWSDARMEIRIRDGRQELMRSGETYDVITLEPPPPSAQGVANLYSVDFYRLAKRRLAAQGLFAQWLPLTTQNDQQTRELVRSFLDAFPFATLWTTELHEMMLVGSDSPITIDANTVEERFSPQSVVASLKAVGVDSPAALLATWVTGREGLEKFAAGARPVTDNDPRVEYGSWVKPDEIARVLPQLLALRTDVPVNAADPALGSKIQTRQQTLTNFYLAGLAAYEGDHEAWESAIARVQADEPENAYYSYLIGRD